MFEILMLVSSLVQIDVLDCNKPMQKKFLRRNLKDHLQYQPLKVPWNPPAATSPLKKGRKWAHIFGFLAITRKRYILWRKCTKQKWFSIKLSVTFVLIIFFVSVLGTEIDCQGSALFFMKNKKKSHYTKLVGRVEESWCFHGRRTEEEWALVEQHSGICDKKLRTSSLQLP